MDSMHNRDRLSHIEPPLSYCVCAAKVDHKLHATLIVSFVMTADAIVTALLCPPSCLKASKIRILEILTASGTHYPFCTRYVGYDVA